ncbi:ABC transporter substrate-binding protein [Reinekea marina]|uniref:Glycine betaine ABC transporter substrate-binding protein n=1 Tax=Reinekea marina TaxID=1310421 RepID=A0ABV7WQX9_9GAMM|nr:ABC transporter substrate-binding protein [Reinekea marina]MDN3647811.1 ABC transporter substrate-binding protein [Reinekea marina]
MKKTTLKLAATTAMALGGSLAFAADECGDVSIADMNWSSATLLAYVDAFILEEGYGCNVEIVPGDTMPTGTSMIEKGEPDIAPEFWIGNFREALDKGVADKRLRYAGRSLTDGGDEGWWVPKYLVDKDPALATIEGIKANVALFEHPEDPDKSMFMGCPAGWGCQINNENLFRALEMEDAGFELVDPGSSAGLAGAIAKSYERGEAWLGYYWAPSAILGKYEMVKVDFGSGIDEEHFYGCITQADCLEPKPTMYPPSEIFSITTESFASKSPTAYNYITQRSVKNNVMNKVLAWMEENQADGEYAAVYFLENHEELWSTWVSKEAAQKIKSAL